MTADRDGDGTSGNAAESQTAMLLTEQEWQDLSFIASWFRDSTNRYVRFPESEMNDQVRTVLRRRDVCTRVIDAAGRDSV